MYIYIGGDKVLRVNEIISIMDAKEINLKKNNAYLVNLEKTFRIEKLNDDIKSIIITKDKVYYSSISIGTLNKRAKL